MPFIALLLYYDFNVSLWHNSIRYRPKYDLTFLLPRRSKLRRYSTGKLQNPKYKSKTHKKKKTFWIKPHPWSSLKTKIQERSRLSSFLFVCHISPLTENMNLSLFWSLVAHRRRSGDVKSQNQDVSSVKQRCARDMSSSFLVKIQRCPINKKHGCS